MCANATTEPEPMSVSPNYSVKDWKELELKPASDAEKWSKALAIFEDRIDGRFFRFVKMIEPYEFSGFAIMALDCLLIETLQQFYDGVQSSRASGRAFRDFLTTAPSFKSFHGEPELANRFYGDIRYGIFHQAETKGKWRISAKKNEPMISRTADGSGIIVNRREFHKALVAEVSRYITKLKQPSDDKDPREKFIKKMNYICRSTEAE